MSSFGNRHPTLVVFLPPSLPCSWPHSRLYSRLTVADGCHTLNEHQTEANCGGGLFSSPLLTLSLSLPLNSVVDIAFRPLLPSLSLSPSLPLSLPKPIDATKTALLGKPRKAPLRLWEKIDLHCIAFAPKKGDIANCNCLKGARVVGASIFPFLSPTEPFWRRRPFSGTFAQHHNSAKGDVKGKGEQREGRQEQHR